MLIKRTYLHRSRGKAYRCTDWLLLGFLLLYREQVEVA